MSGQPDEAREFEPLVRAEGISLVYPGNWVALTGVQLSLRPGELVALVGPSGCGKSTLLRVLAGLIPPTQGRVLIHGKLASEARQNAIQMGILFQDSTLLPWRTIADNVSLTLELSGIKLDRTKVQETLERVGLADSANRFPGELSGGMKMRAALARALVTDPEFLLLDEPFGALDELSRQKLNEELLLLQRNRAWSGIFVTHNVFEATFLSHRVLVLSPRPGRIVAEIPVPFSGLRTEDWRATPEFAKIAGEISRALRGSSK